jgi:hypothetical protein
MSAIENRYQATTSDDVIVNTSVYIIVKCKVQP